MNSPSRIIRFLISGSIAAGIQLGGLYLLCGVFGVWYVLASSLAFIFAVTANFLLQRFWTFGDCDRARYSHQALLFLAVNLFNLTLNAIGLYVGVDFIGLPYLLAQVLVGLGLAVVSFSFYRFIFQSESV